MALAKLYSIVWLCVWGRWIYACVCWYRTRPVAWFTAVVRLAQRRPRSIWTYYHLVLVSALCHRATPIACLSQWEQCGCMLSVAVFLPFGIDLLFNYFSSSFLSFFYACHWEKCSFSHSWLLARGEVMATLDCWLSGWSTSAVFNWFCFGTQILHLCIWQMPLSEATYIL